ncbi:hypothetical protein HYS54_00200 [Candidatus Micrarchaeota archaeon]|nr:hypothetical protein [Candidatus Micrarchaeota archaeon]
MHRVVILKIGGARLHMLKLIGMLVMLGSALMVLDNVYKVGVVVDTLTTVNEGKVPVQAQLDLNGFIVQQTLKPNDANTQLGLLLVPLAGILFWVVVLLFGTMVYKYGGLILPVEEDIGARSKRRPGR